MDAREKLLLSIEERLTVYANWVNQGGGIRSDGAEYLYCDLLNTAFGYALGNMNRIRDNYPAIDLGDEDERLAVQVTSTGDAAKVRKTLERFYAHKLDKDYDRLIVLIAGKAECRPSQFDHPGLELEVWGTAELVAELRGRLTMKSLREVEAFLLERVDAPKVREPVLHLPVPERRNPVGFLGRKTELAWITDELAKGTKPVVIAGLGGVGKTALAVEFRKGWRGQVYFARFDTSFTRTLADSVGMAIEPQERRGLNEEQTAFLALSYLRRCEPGDLLIVDNAEVAGKSWAELTRDPFYEKLRRLPMAVLMTTRHRDTGGRWLGRLDQEELREIFRRHEVTISEGEMDALIEAVDGHTMTVDMIARTIRESWGDVTAETILTAMKTSTLHAGDFDDIENDHDPEQGKIYAHLRALFDLSRISEDGKHALRCATLLPQTGMDEALFRHALPDGAAQEIKRLEKKGWVDRKEGRVTIHPVVRLVCRTELKPTEENCRAFLRGIENKYDPKQYDNAKIRQMAEVFENISKMTEEKDSYWAAAAGYLWGMMGEPGRALVLELRVVKLREQHQQDSKELASSYNNVGTTYSDLGEYQQALEYQMKALRIYEQVLEPDHPHLATSYSNVGSTYGFLGDHQQGLVYKLKALKICERVLKSDHPNLATVYNSVGSTYSILGNHQQALEYQLKALGIRERTLGLDHPDLASSYNNMGMTYSALGDKQKALECQMKAVVIFERMLGSDHPHLATSYNNMGTIYGELGVYEKALEYHIKALRIRERVLGSEHPHLAQSCNNVGGIYHNMGDYDKALEYLQKALRIFEHVLPGNHPSLALSFSNIAWTYHDLGQIGEAATHMRRAAEIINRSTLPETHPKRVDYNKWADRLEREAQQA